MQKLQFPKGFLWGTAGSAYQTEGGNSNTDWWKWEQSQKRKDGLVASKKNSDDFMSGQACDFWNRYDEDFQIAKQLHNNAIRFGIEWAKIEPELGKFDEAVLDHYEKMLQSAKFHGLKVFLTLHHYTCPLWFMEMGGFERKHNNKYFVEYAEKVIKRFSVFVDFWITINEPEVYVGLSYLTGRFPPQKKSLFTSARVANNLIRCHNTISKFIRSFDPRPVSMAFQLADLQPTGFLSKLTENIFYYLANAYIIRRVLDNIDFIGVNYYFHHHVGFFGYRKHSMSQHESTDLGWGIHPEGIERVLLDLKKYKKPIYITENGIADSKDLKREKFIKDHLYFVHKAIEEGVDVRGYLYWSLIDNFEWDQGFWPRFGLVEIDRENNLVRKIRSSALKYAEICRDNGLEYDTTLVTHK